MTHKKKDFLAVILAGVSALLLISPLAMTGTAQARNIKVGIIDCYSGPAAVYGNDALNGFKLALEEINKQGVLGGKIEYTTRDTKFKVDIALNMAKELVMREEVDLLVGTINSAAALAVSKTIAKEQKIPFIVWISKDEKITGAEGHRYVFSTADNTAMGGTAGGVGLSKKPYKKYWIAGDDYAYGHAIADAAWRNLKALKPDVEKIGESWWKVGEPDLVPYLTSIMGAKPDAVIFCTGGASMTNTLKALKTTGMAAKIPSWIHTAIDHAVLKPLAAEGPEGVTGTIQYLFYYPETPENKAFVDSFQKAYGTPPGFPAFNAYLTAHFIAEAFKKAGKIDKEKFIDALEGLKVKNPVGGMVEMRACDHQAVYPMYFGTTKKVPQYDFVIATDITTLKGDEVLPTCDEITKSRGK
ncbi:MAG: amino acid ABC transporter substrate-binding protein [Deltaproteobacteria bacterium RBG_13_49_15]|nr:MAG: amino acid ABC transporter substrate-binding protein [Deltaproteobacteria bacterium RBG_13_49_15]